MKFVQYLNSKFLSKRIVQNIRRWNWNSSNFFFFYGFFSGSLLVGYFNSYPIVFDQSKNSTRIINKIDIPENLNKAFPNGSELISNMTQVTHDPEGVRLNISVDPVSTQVEDILRSSEIEKRVRILCWILTGPDHHATNAKAVKETWGQRCDKLLFMSSIEDKELGSIAVPGVEEGREWLWAKCKGAFQYIWNNHRDDAEWFLKADDDTFVLIDSLRNFLKPLNTSDALYMGTLVGDDPFNKKGYMYGGSGYILSRRSLEKFIKEAVPNNTICEQAVPNLRPHHRGDEDVEMGRCLNNIGGVAIIQPTDSKGRWRFLYQDQETWADDPSIFPGREDCHETLITMHRVEPNYQYMLEYLLYRVKIPSRICS